MSKPESWHDVGNKIRHLRKSSGLTINQLAKGCDLSANTISLVERSRVAPSIETLCKIANALGVSPSSLFLEVCKPRIDLLRADVKHVSSLCGSAVSRLTSTSLSSTRSELKPVTSELLTETAADSRQSILCIFGQIEIEMDQQNLCLNPGDNLTFDSDAFHRWRNSADSPGIAVLVIPPSIEAES